MQRVGCPAEWLEAATGARAGSSHQCPERSGSHVCADDFENVDNALSSDCAIFYLMPHPAVFAVLSLVLADSGKQDTPPKSAHAYLAANARTLATGWERAGRPDLYLRYLTKAAYHQMLADHPGRSAQEVRAKLMDLQSERSKAAEASAGNNGILGGPPPLPALDAFGAPLVDVFTDLPVWPERAKLLKDLRDMEKNLRAYRSYDQIPELHALAKRVKAARETLEKGEVETAQAELAALWTWVLHPGGDRRVMIDEDKLEKIERSNSLRPNQGVSDALLRMLRESRDRYFLMHRRAHVMYAPVLEQLQDARGLVAQAEKLGSERRIADERKKLATLQSSAAPDAGIPLESLHFAAYQSGNFMVLLMDLEDPRAGEKLKALQARVEDALMSMDLDGPRGRMGKQLLEDLEGLLATVESGDAKAAREQAIDLWRKVISA
jgi:hypothetical protein